MGNHMTLVEAEKIARFSTKKELEKYEIPEKIFQNAVLTTIFEGEDRLFVLYAPGKTRDDPLIFAKTRVNLKNRSVKIEISNLSKLEL